MGQRAQPLDIDVAWEVATQDHGALIQAIRQLEDARLINVNEASPSGCIPFHENRMAKGLLDPPPALPDSMSDIEQKATEKTKKNQGNGKCYWFGNICDQNPEGSLPRYPLVAAEGDLKSLMLIKNSVFEVDTLQSGDPPSLQLSNFTVHEDRSNGELILHMSRFHAAENGTWCGDAFVYRIES
ncbi:MAG: hypothetical protein HY360_21055 [Verrucomicrobia bacterium]|nr:hypothetical protein [Verrucomicrobiota bacterium]